MMSEVLTNIKINKKDFLTKNHYKTKLPKQQIIIANSLRMKDNHLVRLKYKDFGKSKKWSTFTIRRNGEVLQHFSDKNHSDFIGIKEVDIKSITITLENMGWLRKIDDVYYNWINEICDKKDVGRKNYMGYEYWHKYTEKQIDSLVELCDYLSEKHNILKSVIDFHHYHKDIKKYKGIVFKSNHIENSTDSNPLLDIKTIKNRLI